MGRRSRIIGRTVPAVKRQKRKKKRVKKYYFFQIVILFYSFTYFSRSE